MFRRIKPFFRKLFLRLVALTPFQIHRCLPVVTLEPLALVLASYDARGETITILQIGACDGINNDPIHHHVVKGHTRAILVEPNPFAFARLQKTYAGLSNITFIQSAIGEKDGEAHLYRVKKTDKTDSEVDLTLQIASFYRKHLEQTQGKSPDQIERITVPCRSLSSLVVELGLTKIDLLQIDTEGFDASVVRMALKMPVRPACIHFEHAHLRTADRKPLFDLLKAHGYLLAYGAWNILALQMPLLKEIETSGLGHPIARFSDHSVSTQADS
jgi:FkbM family methyltransferase